MIVARGLGQSGTPLVTFGWGILEDLSNFEHLFAVTDTNDNFLGVKSPADRNGILGQGTKFNELFGIHIAAVHIEDTFEDDFD